MINAAHVALLHATQPRKAGLFFVAKSEWVLVLLRSQELSEPGTWGLPGGHLNPGEAPREGALRECHEEIGMVPPHLVFHADVSNSYATFFAATGQFEPVLNYEHDAWRWLNLDRMSEDLRADLHPSMPRLIRIARDLRSR